MAENDDPRRGREEKERVNYFSCAFCSDKSPKPFRICESCGEEQPVEGAAGEGGEEE